MTQILSRVEVSNSSSDGELPETPDQQRARIAEAEKHAAKWGDVGTIALSLDVGFRRNLDVLAAAMGDNVLVSQVVEQSAAAA